ncbi:MAG: cytochrome c biogenesis CcdA family protein [Bacillota bacterium]
MASENLSNLVVFIEGLASFASPCVLPLLPVYLGYLAGTSIEEMENSPKRRRMLVLNAVAFVIGLSLVFILLGATASVIGKFVYTYGEQLRKISGVIMIIFGLHHAGILKIRYFDYEKRMALKDTSPSFFNALLLGITFSFGWTPCIGPILGSVLMLAGNTETIIEGMGLLAVYSMGMSVPFIAAALMVNLFMEHTRKIFKYFKLIKLVSGVLLIIMGILIYTNYLYILSSMLAY